jgi:dynein heavy chain
VIWFEEWPDAGYKAVAEYHLKNLSLQGYKDAIIDIMITMHHDASFICKIPNIFPDFLDNFKQASLEIKTKLSEIQEKYDRGLEKLKSAKESVENFQADLDNKNPILKEKKREIAEILEVYREQATYLENRKSYLKQEEKELLLESNEAEALEKECRASLDKAVPDMEEAIEALKQLSKLELSELKVIRKPPKAISLLMSAICIVIQEEPTRVKTKDGQGFVNDYWPTSIGKRVLGNPKLIDVLTSFGQMRDQLDPEAMAKAEEVLQNPDFDYKNIGKASVAAKGNSKFLNFYRFIHLGNGN